MIIGSISNQAAFHLIQPCKNRIIKYQGLENNALWMDDQLFSTMKEAEDYIESKPRIDLTK